MPSFTAKAGTGGDEAAGHRATFRPPWVKEGPSPQPVPSAPWVTRQPPQPSQMKEKPILKKQSSTKIVPIQMASENGSPDSATKGDVPRRVTKPQPQESKEKVVPLKLEQEVRRPSLVQRSEYRRPEPKRLELEKVELRKVEPKKLEPHKKVETEKVELKKVEQKKQEVPKQQEPEKNFKKPEQETMDPVPKDKGKRVRLADEPSVIPPPPPPVPPPPPPSSTPPINKKPLTAERAAKLEALKSRPRKRPDWTDMMKEVETGIKLKHVQCNDRSAPVIPKAKAKGQFVYESETDNVHNQLLKQIQQGVRLKKVRTNDRSRPILDGLRKFRRQMTIEEQIQKSASVADVVSVAAEPDELDDIDKVRDDLQSAKQMLALELRNKEALERENKRLQARLLNLEVELEKEKMSKQIEKGKGNVIHVRTAEDEKLIGQLKDEANLASKMAKDMEEMYHKTAEELDVTRAKLESAWLQNAQLEMSLKSIEKRGDSVPLPKQPSKKLVTSVSNAKVESSTEEETEEETETETETEEDDVAETAALQEKRIMRELKLLTAKLKTLKDKRATALKEKSNLKDQFTKLHKNLNEEKRKYKELQKEVDKMAKLMKDAEEEYEDEEEEEEEETESESESEESEEEEEVDEDLPESASTQDKMKNLNQRIKLYENRLMTLKKSNYLLKANIDRRQDDLNRQKEMSLTLQEDLNSVLAELG